MGILMTKNFVYYSYVSSCYTGLCYK